MYAKVLLRVKPHLTEKKATKQKQIAPSVEPTHTNPASSQKSVHHN